MSLIGRRPISPNAPIQTMAPVTWTTSRFALDLATPKIMGIVNLTPDSFSDGGRHASVDAALRHARQLLDEGAHILDVGAESTRPGAQPVSAQEEWSRLEPVLSELVTWGVPISVDTYKPGTMQRALDLGVDVINDVWALRWADTADGLRGLDVIAAHPQCGVCLMHMHGDPATMQISPMTGDVVADVRAFLSDRCRKLTDRGVASSRIVVDCGTGFGKTVEQNFELLHRTPDWSAGSHVLAGWSRKSSIGAVTGREVHDRVTGSVVAAVLSVERGARVVRVHDVAATQDGLAVWAAARGIENA